MKNMVDNKVECDLVAMVRNMYEVATDRNSRISTINTSFSHHEDYDYISIRAMDPDGNVIANLSRCMDKEDSEA